MQATEQEIQAMIGGLWVDARLLSQRLAESQRTLELTRHQLAAAQQEIRQLRKKKPELEPEHEPEHESEQEPEHEPAQHVE